MSDRAVDSKMLKKIDKNVVAAVAAVVGLYIVLSILGIGCPIQWVTGISCAGCGMTRAYLSLLHLDITHAFMYHPLFWLVPLFLLVFALHKAGKIPVRIANCVMYLTAFIFLIVYVVRLLNPEDVIVAVHIKEGLIWRTVDAVRAVFA